jgi:ammonium transporter, Amt family
MGSRVLPFQWKTLLQQQQWRNPMLVPSPKWLDTGNNAWQLAAATFVGLQSIPGLMVLYGGVVKKKWAINSAFMSMYAFASVLVVWILFDYNMAFGPQWFPFVGTPMPAASAAFTTGRPIGDRVSGSRPSRPVSWRPCWKSIAL